MPLDWAAVVAILAELLAALSMESAYDFALAAWLNPWLLRLLFSFSMALAAALELLVIAWMLLLMASNLPPNSCASLPTFAKVLAQLIVKGQQDGNAVSLRVHIRILWAIKKPGTVAGSCMIRIIQLFTEESGEYVPDFARTWFNDGGKNLSFFPDNQGLGNHRI